MRLASATLAALSLLPLGYEGIYGQGQSERKPVSIVEIDNGLKPAARTTSKESIHKIPLYPEIEPFNTFIYEPPGTRHKILVEEVGKKGGIPFFFAPGGPGYWCNKTDRQLIDPRIYHGLYADLRGSGKNIPLGSLEENDTWAAVADIEAIRKKAGAEKIVFFGGSWAGFLGPTYAIEYPEHVSALVFRGLALELGSRNKWLFERGGISTLYPERYARFMEPLAHTNATEWRDIFKAYSKLLNHPDEAVRQKARKGWSQQFVYSPEAPLSSTEEPSMDPKEVAMANISFHFRSHDYFVNPDTYPTQAQVNKIPDVPIYLVVGQLDFITPVQASDSFYKKLLKTPGRNPDNVHLIIIPGAGHSYNQPGTRDALMRIVNEELPRYFRASKKVK